jgi:hypothetical protein
VKQSIITARKMVQEGVIKDAFAEDGAGRRHKGCFLM